MLVVLRSGSLSCAISRTCFLVTLPTLFLFGSPEPFSISGGLLEEDRRGRRLRDEGERAVGVDRDHDRDDQVVLRLRLRPGVELLAELHDVDAVLAERRADRRRRVRLAGRELQLDETGDLLHDAPLGSGFIGPIPLELQGKSHRGPLRPESFIAITWKSLRFFDLGEVELDRRGAAEDADQHAELLLLGLHFFDDAREVRERPVDDADVLALLEARCAASA